MATFVGLIEADIFSTAGGESIYSTPARGGTQSPLDGDLVFSTSPAGDVTRIWRGGTNGTTLRFNDSTGADLEAWAMQDGLWIHLQVVSGLGNDESFISTDYTNTSVSGGSWVNWINLPAAIVAISSGLETGDRLIVAATLPITAMDVAASFERKHAVRGAFGFQPERDAVDTVQRSHAARGAFGFVPERDVTDSVRRTHAARGAFGFLPEGGDVSGTFGRSHAARGAFGFVVVPETDDVTARFERAHAVRGSFGFLPEGADVVARFEREHPVRGAFGFIPEGADVAGTFGREHEARGAFGFVPERDAIDTFGREHEARGSFGFVPLADVVATFEREHAVRGAFGFVPAGGDAVDSFEREHLVRAAFGFLPEGGDVVATVQRAHQVRGAFGFRVASANAAGGAGVSVTINGADFPGVLFGTVAITRGIHRRAVLSATWRGRLSTLSRHPREGDLIEVTDNRTGRIIFGGHLNAPRLRVLPGNAKGDISLDSVGYYARLEQVQLDQERAIDVVEATTPADQVALIVGALAGEGFTADVDVSGSATIEEDIRFRSLRDAVALLVELHGASVTVDTSRVVYFRDRDRAPDSGVTLDASNVERFTVERDRQHLRTAQRLIGGEVPTSEAFTGNGGTASWRLGGMTDVVSDVDTATLVPGYPGAGASPGLLWRQTYLAFATDGLSGTEDRATFVARSSASGDPINAAYITGDVPAFIGRLALSWDTAHQPAGITVELNLHDQSSSGTPVDMFDSSIVWGYNDPLVAAPTDGAVLLIRNAAARNFHNIINAADLVIEGLPDLSWNACERFPPVYVEGGNGYVGVMSFRTQGRVRFQLGTSRYTIFGRGVRPRR